jgi:hypothetical protein
MWISAEHNLQKLYLKNTNSGIMIRISEKSTREWRMASSGMLRRVALVRTDVSEELSASFIGVTRIGELGTMLAVTSNRCTLHPEANYNNWATATSWRNLVSTFADRGVSRGQCGWTPTAVNLSFVDRSRYFFFQVPPHLSSWGWVDPIPDQLLLGKSGSAGNRTYSL